MLPVGSVVPPAAPGLTPRGVGGTVVEVVGHGSVSEHGTHVRAATAVAADGRSNVGHCNVGCNKHAVLRCISAAW